MPAKHRFRVACASAKALTTRGQQSKAFAVPPAEQCRLVRQAVLRYGEGGHLHSMLNISGLDVLEKYFRELAFLLLGMIVFAKLYIPRS